MAHFKRRKRRKGGIKGHCGMCCLVDTDGRRNGRRLTWQEKRHKLSYAEALQELKAKKE